MNPDPQPHRVLIADDHLLFAEGLRRLLEDTYRVVGIAENGRDLLQQAQRLQPDVVVTDLSMPIMDGIEATHQLSQDFPDTPVVMLSMHAEGSFVKAALDAGAAAYLLKSANTQELYFALEQVLRGHLYVTPSLTRVAMGRTSEAIRVLIADDDETTRYGLASLLASFDDMEVIGEAANGQEAVQQASKLRPTVILMDLQMPHKDGVEATREILADASPAVLALTGVTETVRILDAVRAGALGYLAKGSAPQDIAKAVRQVHDGNRFLPPNITEALVTQSKPTPPQTHLTTRELEIARLVAAGKQNKDIADLLHVSQVTVRTHLRNVFEKLEVTNRVELALYALRAGWVSLDDLDDS